MTERQIALVALALGKLLHEQWSKEASELYLNAEKEGLSPQECTRRSSGVVRQDGVLRKWRPTKDDNFAYNDANPTHNRENKQVDIMNMPFEELPSSWKGTNLEAGLVAAALIGSVPNFNIANLPEYIGYFAPVIHEEWMMRNSWEKDSKPELFVDYSRLTPEMQKLDDAHIIVAANLTARVLRGEAIINIDEKNLEETLVKLREVQRRLFDANSLKRKI